MWFDARAKLAEIEGRQATPSTTRKEKVKMITLYEKHKDSFDKIAVHRPQVAELSKHFNDFRSMEQALGFGTSVVSKWVSLKCAVSHEAERRAITWLNMQKQLSLSATPQPAAPVAPASSSMMLVICQPDNVAKVQRILTIMGCEFTDV